MKSGLGKEILREMKVQMDSTNKDEVEALQVSSSSPPSCHLELCRWPFMIVIPDDDLFCFHSIKNSRCFSL